MLAGFYSVAPITSCLYIVSTYIWSTSMYILSSLVRFARQTDCSCRFSYTAELDILPTYSCIHMYILGSVYVHTYSLEYIINMHLTWTSHSSQGFLCCNCRNIVYLCVRKKWPSTPAGSIVLRPGWYSCLKAAVGGVETINVDLLLEESILALVYKVARHIRNRATPQFTSKESILIRNEC